MKQNTPEKHDEKYEYMEAMHAMEEVVPMLAEERRALHNWVGRGNHPENNPWGYLDADDWPMNYVEAYRRRKGYYFNVYYHIIEG